MKNLCAEPISTGIMDKRPTFEPCGRPLHGDTGLCREHAILAGLVVRPDTRPLMGDRAPRRRPTPRGATVR